MAVEGKKIGSLTEATSLVDTDVFVMETAAPVTKKTKWLTMCNAIKEKINRELKPEVITTGEGTAWKYPDGRLIQFGDKLVPVANEYILQTNVQLPVPNVSEEYIVIAGRQSYGNQSNALDLIAYGQPYGVDYITVGVQRKAGGMTDAKRVHWLVIGRWK